jgi:hypothetical protein
MMMLTSADDEQTGTLGSPYDSLGGAHECGVGVEGVAVVEQAARRLSRPVPGSGACRHVGVGARWGFVGFDDAQCFVDCVEHLDRSDDDAAEGVSRDGALSGVAESGVVGGLEGDRRQPSAADGVPGE